MFEVLIFSLALLYVIYSLSELVRLLREVSYYKSRQVADKADKSD